MDVLTRETKYSVFGHGDRVCFIGDSITHSGTYHSLIYLYQLTRFPGAEITLWNCGRAGGCTNQVIERYDREITPLRPTWAVLMFGMNDCGRHRYGRTHEMPEDHASRKAHFTEFKLRTHLLVERLRADGCQIILQTPTPYDQTATERPGFPPDGRVTPGLEHANDALARFAQWIRRQAPSWQARVVDYHRPCTNLTLRQQHIAPEFSMTGDRVHPDRCWHLLLAYEFLTQLGMPDLVSEVRVDAIALRCDATYRSVVTDLRRDADGLSFCWHAEALPFPLDPVYEPVLSYVPFHERLNREMLTVTGLENGSRYELLIDDHSVTTVTAGALTVGVNLALLSQTPQFQQARALMRLNNERHALNERLQDANMIESWRPAGQSDAEALAAAHREAARADVPGCAWSAKVNQNFIDLHGQVEKTREQLADMMCALNAQNRPQPHRCRLRRLAGADSTMTIDESGG